MKLSARLYLLILVHLISLPASGQEYSCPDGKICVLPRPSHWTYSLCTHNGSLTATATQCAVSGGVWSGWQGCPGGRSPDSDQQVIDWSIEIAQVFAPEGEVCQISQTLGWGVDVGSQNCGGGGPVYDSGHLLVDNQYIEMGNCNQSFSARKSRVLECPPGSGYVRSPLGSLICTYEADFSCGGVGNPIMPLVGNKVQQETDYARSGIRLSRYYNSSGSLVPYNAEHAPVGFFGTHGNYWRTNFDYHLYELTLGGAISGYALSFPNGFVQLYDEQLVPTSAMYRQGRLSKIGDITVYQNDGITLTFNANNQLMLMQVGGQEYTLNYSSTVQSKPTVDADGNTVIGDLPPGFLLEVKRNNQLIYAFDYDSEGRMVLAHNAGDSILYKYDLADNLIEVVRNSGGIRFYHYENTSFPAALTGITDEQNVRFATWEYDNHQRAISSEHADGKEKTELDYIYAPLDHYVKVANPLGKVNNFHYANYGGVRKIIQVEGEASANCAAANKSYDYYPNGTLKSKTDWEGNSTSYIRDNFGRETARTEASGTPEARTVTTEYHPTLNQPIRITEPGLITEYSYDSEGRLLNTTKHATAVQ